MKPELAVLGAALAIATAASTAAFADDVHVHAIPDNSQRDR